MKKLTLIAKPSTSLQNLTVETFPFLIGRDESPFAELVLESEETAEAVNRISRRHVIFYEKNGKILIKDLGSKNGTKLNGQKLGIDPVEVEYGDSVGISGTFEFTLAVNQNSRVSERIPHSLTLIPEDPDFGLSTIDITTYPFHIGRKQNTFLKYEDSLPIHIKSLSRKHAKITYKDSRFFLQDLGSTNGTILAGEALGQIPKLISNNDQIIFGRFFKYIAKIVDEDIAFEKDIMEEVGRTLITDSNKISYGSTSIVDIQNDFPIDDFSSGDFAEDIFRLGKSDLKVEESKEAYPVMDPTLRKMTVQEKSDLYEEKAGESRGESKRAVQISDSHQNRSVAVDNKLIVKNEQGNETGTVYIVSNATQFLKILTPEEKHASKENNKKEDFISKADHQRRGAKEKNRILCLAKEIFNTFSASPANVKKRRWFVTGLLPLIVIASVWWFVSLRMPEQKLKRLMIIGQYGDAVELSDQVLSKKPGDEDIRKKSTEALMRASLPEFTDALKMGRIKEAKNIIRSYANYTSHNPDGKEALELLFWIVDLEFYFSHNDPNRPINLIRDEAVIEPLVSRWEVNEDNYRFFMEQMVQRSRSFESIRSIVYHHLNVLETKTIYFDSVKKLNQTIREKLASEHNEEIMTVIDEYERKYPNTGGLSELRHEAGKYLELLFHLRNRDLVKISNFLKVNQFHTPIFKQELDVLKKDILPDSEIGLKVQSASQKWATGDFDKAISILEALANGPWGDIAEAKLDHYRRVLDLMAKASQTKGTAEHSTHIVALHRILSPNEDQFYYRQVEDKFVGFRDQELKASQRLMDKAKQGWSNYLNSGKIIGLLRLEATVSRKFRQMAGYLRTCFEQSRSGVKIYKKLGLPLPEKWNLLHARISTEVVVQRTRIEDLAAVLGPDVSNAKLALLPAP
jgi:pSer/pThr/pTyr-binding forkhead associated (FHA) protein